jgi:acyl-CoA reductase-like NAD-dependent aldehyde dehydrogenase
MVAPLPSVERAAQSAKVKAVPGFLRHSPTRPQVNGKEVTANSGKTGETINPANEEALSLAAESDKAEVDDAPKVARRAFEEGTLPAITPHQPARFLLGLVELTNKHADELAELENLNNGKPASQARSADIAVAVGIFGSHGSGQRADSPRNEKDRRCQAEGCTAT